MYLFKGKVKKLTIKYKGDSFNFEIVPYETISHIKKLIMKIEPNINLNEYNLICENKDIPNDDDLRLDEITKSKNILIELSKKENENNKIEQLTIKCKCNKNNITTFCRKCLKFICNDCKKLLHSEHKTFTFDSKNLSENIKFYSIKLQAEISENLKQYSDIENMFKNSLLIDYLSYKEMIIRKLNSMEDIFKKFEQFNSLFKETYENLEKIALETSRKIDKITEEISWNLLNDKKKSLDMKYEEFNRYFNILSENESVIKIIKNEVDSRKEEFEINKKINKIFSNIDSLFNSIENLTNKSYEIIKKKNDEILNTNNNDDDNKFKENKKKNNIVCNTKKGNKNIICIRKSLKSNKIKSSNNDLLFKSENNLCLKDNEMNQKNIFENKKKILRESYNTFIANNIESTKNKNNHLRINSNINTNSYIKLPYIQNLFK